MTAKVNTNSITFSNIENPAVFDDIIVEADKIGCTTTADKFGTRVRVKGTHAQLKQFVEAWNEYLDTVMGMR